MEPLYCEIITDSLENGFMILDDSFTVFTWNKWLELKTGVPKNNIINAKLQTFFPDIDYKVLQRKINTVFFLGSPSFYDGSSKPFMHLKRFKVTDKSTEHMHLNVVISPYLSEEKKVMISLYDVSELYDLQKALKKEMDVVQSLYQEIHRDKITMDKTLLMLKTDLNGIILDVSDAACAFLGYTKTELIGEKASIFRDPEIPASLFAELWESISNKIAWRGEVKNVAKDGSSHWLEMTAIPIIENNEILHYIAIYNDIQDKKKIERLAMTDPLTQLSNRGHFDKLFEKLINNTKRSDDNLSLIIVDIDFFKKVNDTYGHQTGDMVLVKVAALMKETLRENDILARWGGEEFVILLTVDPVSATKVAEKLRKKIEAMSVEKLPAITCSFGVTGYKEGDITATMFIGADEALYRAKENGRNRVELT